MIRQQEKKSPPDMRGGLGDLAADLISLSELQLELLAVDSRDALQASKVPGILICLGVGLVSGACPVVLLGISWWLSEATTMTMPGALLLVATLALIGAGGLLMFGCKRLKRSLGMLKRSRDELRSNTRWIKKILSEKQNYQRGGENSY